MVLLAVETTSPTGSLCLSKIGQDLTHLTTKTWTKKSSHSEIITLELQDALHQARLELTDITHFAVDAGPGSFTGIRVGVNFIRTLAYALDKNVRILNSLEILARQEMIQPQRAIIAIPAIQNYFYAQAFTLEKGRVIGMGSPQSQTKVELDALLARTNAEKIIYPTDVPRAETLAQLVFENSEKSLFSGWKDVLPLYVRKSEAEEKLLKGLLKS